jgi:ABC-type glycerol-3-phosphate transport system substrate-binding protein
VPTSAATTAVGSQPTPPAQAAPAGGKVAMSIATYASPQREWQRYWAKQWADKHPNVTLKIDQMVYADAPQKQLTELATNTLQDVAFSGIKWFPYSVYKGVFRPIDDYVKASDPGMDDYFSAAIAGATFDGKLYALPYLVHPGNNSLVLLNLDLLDKKGVKPPTDDWTVKEFLELATTMTDKANRIYGTDFFTTTYYDFCSMARSWGGDDLSADGKTFTFATDPKSVEAARWTVDLRATSHAAPSRADSTGLAFPSGSLATSPSNPNGYLGEAQTVGNKFKWDIVLFPKGPTGIRGYQGFVEMFSVSSKSQQPDLAYDLVMQETSKETGTWAVANSHYQPSARKSVWSSPEAAKLGTIFQRTLDWMSTVKGPFPMPYNLRYSELEDKWENVSQALFYGEVPFEEGMQKVQQACQAIVSLGRP